MNKKLLITCYDFEDQMEQYGYFVQLSRKFGIETGFIPSKSGAERVFQAIESADFFIVHNQALSEKNLAQQISKRIFNGTKAILTPTRISGIHVSDKSSTIDFYSQLGISLTEKRLHPLDPPLSGDSPYDVTVRKEDQIYNLGILLLSDQSEMQIKAELASFGSDWIPAITIPNSHATAIEFDLFDFQPDLAHHIISAGQSFDQKKPKNPTVLTLPPDLFLDTSSSWAGYHYAGVQGNRSLIGQILNWFTQEETFQLLEVDIVRNALLRFEYKLHRLVCDTMSSKFGASWLVLQGAKYKNRFDELVATWTDIEQATSRALYFIDYFEILKRNKELFTENLPHLSTLSNNSFKSLANRLNLIRNILCHPGRINEDALTREQIDLVHETVSKFRLA